MIFIQSQSKKYHNSSFLESIWIEECKVDNQEKFIIKAKFKDELPKYLSSFYNSEQEAQIHVNYILNYLCEEFCGIIEFNTSKNIYKNEGEKI